MKNLKCQICIYYSDKWHYITFMQRSSHGCFISCMTLSRWINPRWGHAWLYGANGPAISCMSWMYLIYFATFWGEIVGHWLMVKMDRAYLYEFFAQLNIEEINPQFNKICDTYDEVFGCWYLAAKFLQFGASILAYRSSGHLTTKLEFCNIHHKMRLCMNRGRALLYECWDSPKLKL